MSTRPQVLVFTDWDETITAHDTLCLIAPPVSDEPNAPPPFSFFSEYYSHLKTEHDNAFGPRETLDRELQYLASLGPIEKATIAKVERSGLFRGIKEYDLCERAKQVKFRDGWTEFTEQVEKKEHVRLMSVLSISWSRSFIRHALRRIHDDEFLDRIEIRANDLEMDSGGVGTGKLTKKDGEGIYTGQDKLREMKSALEELSEPGKVVTVYVGDSNTDLPCLMFADIGIIIGNNSSLLETCKRVGIHVAKDVALSEISEKKNPQIDVTLYQYPDWHGIIDSGLTD